MYQQREIFHLYELQPLLEKAGLKRNGDTDFTLGLYDGSRLVATGSIRDSIVQMVAVDPDYQGEGLAAKVVSALLSRASYEGWLPLYLFTKPENAQTFSALGFRLVTAAPPYAALLEGGAVRAQAGDDAADARWFDVAVQRREGRVQLMLTGGVESLFAECAVERTASPFGGQTVCTLVRQQGLAFDHGKILCQAVEMLWENDEG